MGPRHAVPTEELARLMNTSAVVPKTSASYQYIALANDVWDELDKLRPDACLIYKNPLAYWQSPYIHTVVLKGLKPRTRYTYQPGGSQDRYTFITPAAPGDVHASAPFKMGVWADVGITNVSFTNMLAMKHFNPELVLLAGDFSYADGWHPRWETFGSLHEPLMSSVATLGVMGNHEISTGKSQGVDFKALYPVPYRASGSETPMWYSYEAGPVHVTGMVGSYAPTDKSSAQYKFVAEDFARVNRTRTPWLVVQFHTPWYSSSMHHYQEAMEHQKDMEDLFFEHGVDMVFNGHLHDYERSHPVYRNKLNDCGPTHIVVGDGGNHEGPASAGAKGWHQPQPEWSAFRETSFGIGLFTVHNATHSEWTWRRGACVHKNTSLTDRWEWDGVSGPEDGCKTEGDMSEQATLATDTTVFVRDVARCPARNAGTGAGLPQTPTPEVRRRSVQLPAQAPIAAPKAGGSRRLAAGKPLAAPTVKGSTQEVNRQAASRPMSMEEVLVSLAGASKEGTERRLRAEVDPVQQVHLGLGGKGEAVVTFVTHERGVSSTVLYGKTGQPLNEKAVGSVSTYAVYQCPTNGYLFTPPLGDMEPVPLTQLASIVNTSEFLPPTSASYTFIANKREARAQLENGCVAYKNPRGYYQAPYIHTVTLEGLEPRASYTYKPEAGNREFTFTMPAAEGAGWEAQPFHIGVWADVGTTNVSVASMQALQKMKPEMVLLVGDYSYADGWAPTWETFGVMTEPLMSSVPTLGVPGNHEIAEGRYQNVDWVERYPVPFRESGSDSPNWYSYNSGPVHIVGLVGSYAPTEQGSAQYQFLEDDLSKVDRRVTPWVVVMFHTPMYNSNENHYQEGYKMQTDMEELLYTSGVDVVLNGHVHSYERTHPVYKDQPDACGITHIVIGDAGNYEGPAVPWHEPQPAWSAFRSGSYGVGELVVHNATHARWDWRRVACVEKELMTNRGSDDLPYWVWKGSDNLEAAVAACSTQDDNSAQAHEAYDGAWLVRDAAAGCGNEEGSKRLRGAVAGADLYP